MLMIIPCTVNCLTRFVSAQVNQLQHAVPVQQRYKTPADHEKHHSPLGGHRYKDSEAWGYQEGEAQALRHPSSAGSSQKDLDTPISKELSLLSLEGGNVRYLE